MPSNATVIYNTVHQYIEQIVLDANNLSDPSFNPPDCIQISIEPVAYQNMQADEFQDYINTIIEQMQGNV